MANYQLLKADIDEKVYENARQEITGANLNAVLNAMVTTLGAGYQFAGVATIDTNPENPDAKVFYIANGKGTYTNFGGIEVTEDEVVVLYWDSLWHKVSTGIASQAKLSELGQEVFGEKVLNWSDGYINTSGRINSSTQSKFSQPFLLKAGQSVTVGTNNTNACLIAKTTADSISIGDSVTPLYSTTGTPGFVSFTYTATEDTKIVVSAKWSDKLISFDDPESLVGQIKSIEKSIDPDYTADSRINNSISELYIDGFTEGMKFNIFSYISGLLTVVIKDANDNLYTFANNKPVSANTITHLSKSGIDLYVILTGQAQSVFPTNTTIYNCVADLKFNPSILTYLINQQEAGIDTLIGTKGTYPLCVSRFNRGTLPNADHNACWVAISRRFTNTKDSVVSFANKINANITNKFFDLYSIGTIDRGIDAVAPVNDYTDPSTFWSLSTSDAIFMPMIVGAVHNIDGDNTTGKWFTGGAHAYGNESDGVSPTIREISCDVLVDGKNVPIGTIGVRGNSCDIYVVENIQGWNTCKQDGTGREIIQRKTHVKVTNCKIAINVEIKALEDVIIDGPLYASGIGTNNADGFRFIGSHSKMGIYTGEAIPANDDNEINAFRYIKSSFIFDCLYNLGYGVKNKYVTSVANLFASDAGKAYFRAIQQGVALELMQNDSIFYCTEISLSENK